MMVEFRVMRRAAAQLLLALTLASVTPVRAAAQMDAAPIGPFVFDLRGTFPHFPDGPTLASSRGLNPNELPGFGTGLDAGGHVFLLRWKGITIGLGGQFTTARAHFAPSEEATATIRPVSERFTTIAPHLSLNFGTGDGWSYVSAGIGSGTWSVVPDGVQPGPADEERLRVWNYGGGARWFARPHLAFTFDVRVHVVDPGTAYQGRPGSPQTLLLFMGAGISVK